MVIKNSIIKELLSRPFLMVVGFMFGFDGTFRQGMMKEIDHDTQRAFEIMNQPYFDRGEVENWMLSQLKTKYQFGKYKVSFFYPLCSRKLQEQYKKRHQDICRIIADGN